MKLHDLSPAPGSRRARKRVGRGPGSGNGKTAGRGHNGQRSRAGYSRRAGFEGGQMPLVRRQPKLPGFNNPNKVTYTAINIAVLEEQFSDGDTVSRETLAEKGLVRKKQPVKILGHGELTKKLTVTGVAAISGTAREKVEAAGGQVDV